MLRGKEERNAERAQAWREKPIEQSLKRICHSTVPQLSIHFNFISSFIICKSETEENSQIEKLKYRNGIFYLSYCRTGQGIVLEVVSFLLIYLLNGEYNILIKGKLHNENFINCKLPNINFKELTKKQIMNRTRK